MNFKEKVEKHMKMLGITRAELSRATKIPYTTIDSILRRDEIDMIKLPVVQALADFFQTSLDYLLRDEITDPNYGFLKEHIENFDIDHADMISFEDGYDEPRQVSKEEAANIYRQILDMPPEVFGDMNVVMEFLQWKHRYKK